MSRNRKGWRKAAALARGLVVLSLGVALSLVAAAVGFLGSAVAAGPPS